jgi:hypothetical protein
VYERASNFLADPNNNLTFGTVRSRNVSDARAAIAGKQSFGAIWQDGCQKELYIT